MFFATLASGQTEDGLFAVFQTNRGAFTARLDYDKVPTTVANFVGLVEGTRGWVDTSTGTLRRQPFYNGLTFHRVVPGFIIQSGAPNGEGTAGPGYTFGDEFHPALRHDSAGILSMGNSGASSNGSQFFITLNPISSLNNKHSVFGQVVDGMDVVNSIGSVPTPIQAPEEITTIEQITIIRVGAAAEAFDAAGPWGLPELVDAEPALLADAGSYWLRFGRSPFSKYFISRSDDLTIWTQSTTLTDLVSAPASDHDVTADISGKAKQFFRVVKACYLPQAATFVNKTLAFQFISSDQTLELAITGEPRGSFIVEQPLGTVVLDGEPSGFIGAYVFAAGLNHQEFVAAFELFDPLRISLHYRTATQGWFTAQNYYATDGIWPIFGHFEVQTTP